MGAPRVDCVKFEIVSPCGPTAAHHVGCVINKCLYIHGGVNQPGCKFPLNGLYEFSITNGIWSDLTTKESPALSYHACVPHSNRYFVLIGGWNGRSRVSDVKVFDTDTKKWLGCKTVGFPPGSGLSSHSANPLSNGDILIIGREGFLKTQRRFASMFVISCKIPSCLFEYTKLETTVGSRSGHSCNMIGQRMFILGGRADDLMETHAFTTPGTLNYANVFLKEAQCHSKQPKIITRRYHATAVCNSGSDILLHGGRAFDGKHREALSECFLLTCKPMVTKWTYLGDSNVNLSGHIMCEFEDTIFVHGGENNLVKCTLYKILPTY